MKKNLVEALALFLILAFSLPACAPQVTSVPPVLIDETATPATPALTPTPVVRSLTICLGEEPNTLYPFGSLNASARSVLSAIYDGPMDVTDYAYEPIILEKVPALEDGDAQISPVTVTAGSE
ncbi:MAG TPA: hypothetical protein VHO49_10950, partial [Anaerolineales bacterium]|nr:hypothetical protein [Anaerolineales bacterium]